MQKFSRIPALAQVEEVSVAWSGGFVYERGLALADYVCLRSLASALKDASKQDKIIKQVKLWY